MREAASGTSNATGYTYTLPFSTADYGFSAYGGFFRMIDNGVSKTGYAITTNASSNVLNCYTDAALT